MFLDGDGVVRASLDCGVISDDHALDTVHTPNTGNDASCRDLVFVQFMSCKLTNFKEWGSIVQQTINTMQVKQEGGKDRGSDQSERSEHGCPDGVFFNQTIQSIRQCLLKQTLVFLDQPLQPTDLWAIAFHEQGVCLEYPCHHLDTSESDITNKRQVRMGRAEEESESICMGEGGDGELGVVGN